MSPRESGCVQEIRAQHELLAGDNASRLVQNAVLEEERSTRTGLHLALELGLSEIDEAVGRAMAREPDVIGLSIQFQHRAPEFLQLARKLREAGYRGHLTCGGQFPTLAWRETLEGANGVDSVVLHDAEETIVEFL